MLRRLLPALLLLFSCLPFFAQEIETGGGPEKKLKLSSNVELRTWKLSTKAEKTEEPLMGATIVLLKGSTVVHKSATNINGDFEVLVPMDGEFILEVSYKDCNTKRFYVSTLGVPDEVKKEGYFKPTFSIGGFVMAKPFPGIDYSGLQQPLVKVTYSAKIKNFDDDAVYTDVGLGIVSKIADAENILIEKFCSTNRAGDAALAKPDCPLAKKLYNEAIALIPGEQYPVVQLAKVGDCLKAQEEEQKKKEQEAAAKAEKEKAKEEAAKAEAEKKAAEKFAKEQAAKEKAEADKAAKDKAAADKAEADKVAKEKAAADKAEADRVAKEKAATDKAAKDQKAAEKAEADRVAKEKAASDKAAKDQKAADKAAADKLARQKAAEEKAAKAKKPVAEPSPDQTAKSGTAKPKDPEPIRYETPSDNSSPSAGHGDSKYKVPQVLGANKYKDALNKAEGLYKMKRYKEAKAAYEDVLRIKPDDTYSKNKLAEIEKLITK